MLWHAAVAGFPDPAGAHEGAFHAPNPAAGLAERLDGVPSRVELRLAELLIVCWPPYSASDFSREWLTRFGFGAMWQCD